MMLAILFWTDAMKLHIPAANTPMWKTPSSWAPEWLVISRGWWNLDPAELGSTYRHSVHLLCSLHLQFAILGASKQYGFFCWLLLDVVVHALKSLWNPSDLLLWDLLDDRTCTCQFCSLITISFCTCQTYLQVKAC